MKRTIEEYAYMLTTSIIALFLFFLIYLILEGIIGFLTIISIGG